MDKIKIERLGGLAGFGSTGSALVSRGEQAISKLSSTERTVVDALFKTPNKKSKFPSKPDEFRYRITRTDKGREQTIEVPQAVVPSSLQSIVVDGFK